ncbi:MAG: U2 small nuclear ribonucleo A -like [Trebouxia sp. A1-2]|nr:MAG: U2 small nuclear ribonucleo A -like [Trebouxia sp. A1-2]
MEGRAGAGALGPRLAGRLTAELILRSPQYMSCVKDYEIDLRGHKLSAIENLGATENQFDSLDLSDNVIVRLEGFPKLPRLKTLLLSNNRVMRISRNLEDAIPNLDWLVLSGNRLSNLAPNYRLYVIHRCKKLKQLDFRKVKQKEREEAAKVIGAAQQPADAAADEKATTFEPDEDLAQAEAATAAAQQQAAEPVVRKGPSPEQITAIKAAIANAQTLEEVQRLENALTSGHLPSELQKDVTADSAQNGHKTDGSDPPSAMEEG